MPEFADPFSGEAPDRKLTLGELIGAIRLDLAAKHEAVHAPRLMQKQPIIL
jgi:hypothetical protein